MTEDAAPFAFEAPLSVCVDVKHPECYLALAAVRRFAEQRAVGVDWLPFPAAALKPPPAPAGDRGTRHRRARAAYQASEIARYAAVQGVVIDDPLRSADSTAVSLAHLWLREQDRRRVPEFLEQVFRGHWERTLDIEAPDAMAGVLADLGLDPEPFARFAAGPGPHALAAVRAALVAAGVFTVPSLVIDDEVFVGRAHLPMVAWILGGRAGPPPI